MKKLITTILILSFLSSCAIKKKIEKSDNSSTYKSLSKRNDSTSTIMISEPIDDQFRLPIEASGNKELDDKFDKLLSRLNTEKKSGNNGYKIIYDPELKELLLDIKIGQTENKEVNTSTETEKEKTVEERIEQYVEKVKIPMWIYISLIVWFLPQILTRVNMIINPISGFMSKHNNKK